MQGSEAIDTYEFWQRLQAIIPPGGRVTWQRLWREFGRRGTGRHTELLRQRGYLKANHRGEIWIAEDKRGQDFEAEEDA